jgi:hypothetical protein
MEEPIACTFSPSEYGDRTSELAAVAGRALRSREQTADGERPHDVQPIIAELFV